MKRFFRRFYERFISLKGEPRNLALGFAIGLALGIFPLWGIHTAFAILIASAFRVHLSSMVVASWILGNPLTFPPILFAQFYLGRWVLNDRTLSLPQNDLTISALLPMGVDLFNCIIIGFLILAGLVAILGYPIARLAFQRIMKSRTPVLP